MSLNDLSLALRGVTFNGKHNRDLSIVMHTKSIQSPAKKKLKESIPFMNGEYDFSTVGSNGEIMYENREITMVFGLPTKSKEELQTLYSKVLSWIVDANKSKLIFDDCRDYYYMAEVEAVSSFEEAMSFGRLTVTLVADPFKTSVDYIGNDIWDTFNFEEDRTQTVEFDVVNIQGATIYNAGRRLSPTITCSSAMTLMLNNYTYSLSIGDNTFYNLQLDHGSNFVQVNGNGHIKFNFRKETL